MTHYGNCYKLRPTVPDDKNLAQILPGFNFGLQITMTFNSSDGPIYSPSGVSQEGFYLSIGDHMTVLDSSAVTVGPGKYVSVNLSLHRYLYDPSVSTCTSALAALNYTKGGVTSVDLCKQECQVMINLKFCFCSPPYPNVQLPADKICQPQSAYSCFQRDGSLLTNSTYRAAVKNCQNQNCPNLCDSLRYVPFTVYSMAAPKNPGGDTMLETSVANVFFEEFAYTLVSLSW